MSHQVELSNRAARDLDRLGRDVKYRIIRRLEQLADEPYNTRLSNFLTNQGGLRKSRVGGWRIIFSVNDSTQALQIVTIERRGQVYQRI